MPNAGETWSNRNSWCRSLLVSYKAKHTLTIRVKVKVTQSCPTLCDPRDCIFHGILQPRILEWVAVPFSRGSSQYRDQTQVSQHCRRILYQLWLRRESICLQCSIPGFSPWVGKISWRRKWQSTPVFLPGKSHGRRRSLVGYSPWGCKELDTTERLHSLKCILWE